MSVAYFKTNDYRQRISRCDKGYALKSNIIDQRKVGQQKIGHLQKCNNWIALILCTTVRKQSEHVIIVDILIYGGSEKGRFILLKENCPLVDGEQPFADVCTVVVHIDDVCVLGWTSLECIELLKSTAMRPGHRTKFRFIRGNLNSQLPLAFMSFAVVLIALDLLHVENRLHGRHSIFQRTKNLYTGILFAESEFEINCQLQIKNTAITSIPNIRNT
ncbi:hypothetical protein GJ496_000823 [Pomphorhynchus laevis]|nr:hypothetical protein GJ496_000823 [Pomphorhynchus laevis]